MRWSRSAESSWRRRSRRGNSRPASSAVPRQPCQNNGTRRSLPDPDRENRCGRAHAISYLTRVCTRTVRLCVNGRKIEPGMNAQLYTLRDATRLPTAGWRKFLRSTPGKSGRPGLSGGLRKRSQGGNEIPPRNRKSEPGNPPPTVVAPEFYPNQFKTGKLGGAEATMSELWNAALAA